MCVCVCLISISLFELSVFSFRYFDLLEFFFSFSLLLDCIRLELISMRTNPNTCLSLWNEMLSINPCARDWANNSLTLFHTMLYIVCEFNFQALNKTSHLHIAPAAFIDFQMINLPNIFAFDSLWLIGCASKTTKRNSTFLAFW